MGRRKPEPKPTTWLETIVAVVVLTPLIVGWEWLRHRGQGPWSWRN